MDRISTGEDVATAAQAALEKLRSEGVKLRARRVCWDSMCVCVSVCVCVCVRVCICEGVTLKR